MTFYVRFFTTMVSIFSLIYLPSCNRSPVQFEPLPLPETEAEMLEVRASASVHWFGKKIESPFQILLRTGDRFGENVFGRVVDKRGRPVRHVDSLFSMPGERGFESSGVYSDYTSLIEKDGQLFAIHHIETIPGAVYIAGLERNSDGRLKVQSVRPVLTEHGIYNPCAGSVTPWGTHLGSEEYEPNAALRMPDGKIHARYNAMVAHFTGSGRSTERLRDMNPYWYGWVTEIAVRDVSGNTDVHKRYALGRFSVELAYVLPDRRTVYMTDDGKNVGLFMFVADRPDDLSSGTLYAARWHQLPSAESPGFQKTQLYSARLEWISLGHADEKQIGRILDTGVNANMNDGAVLPHFHQLFDTASPERGVCPPGFRSINAGTKNMANPDWEQECLRLRTGNVKGIPVRLLASRLETRRFAAYLGATTEFRKEEGLTYDADRNRLYIAYSKIEGGMKQGSADDEGGPDHIQLQENICGAVYSARLSGDQSDTSGQRIDSRLVAVQMDPLLTGYPLSSGDRDYADNECSTEGIAEPDNISYLNGSGLLVIGEDSTHGHQTDVIWTYDVTQNRLTRILTSPPGSENTSVYWHTLQDGSTYLTAVVQHPYGEPIKRNGRIGQNPQSFAPSHESFRAYVGVFGPFP